MGKYMDKKLGDKKLPRIKEQGKVRSKLRNIRGKIYENDIG